MLGRHRPGSEGNLASDFENQEQELTADAVHRRNRESGACQARRPRSRRAPKPEGVKHRRPRSKTRTRRATKAEAAGSTPEAAERKPKRSPAGDRPEAEPRARIPTSRQPKSDARRAAGTPQPAGRLFDSSRRAAPRAIRPQERQRARSGGAQGHEHPEAQPDRQGSRRPGLRGTAQAGADLQDPAGAGRKERADLLRRRARMPARRLRLPARARIQLSARPRRRLRFAFADPPVRSAHRRHRQRPDPAAQGRRAVLRADQSRRDQLRAARGSAQQDLLRQPDAALSAGAAEDGNRQGQLSRAA